ncbi:MAG: hypothetical protein IPN85_00145 [Flavobacteriales bacterium]|nr:hypothetical protein [Flavobacteriales bacterium]
MLVVVIALLTLLLLLRELHLIPSEQGPAPTVPETPAGPFTGIPLRFDGHYRTESGDVIRLMRYFPEGRVVVINGTREMDADLPKFLIRETKGDPAMGLHNVPVTVKGDSLLFTVHPEKGDIDFRVETSKRFVPAIRAVQPHQRPPRADGVHLPAGLTALLTARHQAHRSV